ncbi:MAG: ketosteroid isomerase-like protein [Flavobacteriales bacterium]|jgi:ketosteroid isomerase-like protein|tara:strand:+ start:1774 stop:2388 length:615 start_codon:yes stop_codon:yes gene_type:complete
MSKNLEIVQNLYNYIETKEFENIRPLFHKNIKWNQMKGLINGGNYVGADEVFQHVFTEFGKEWTDWKAEAREFLEASDDIIVVGTYSGIFKKSGKKMEAEFMHRYTLNAGVVTIFQQYTDTGLFAKAMKGAKTEAQINNPLHGISLKEILEYLLAEYDWEGLAKRVNINCFKSNQTINSSLNFLRKYDWAREEVEFLYIKSIKN